MTLPFADRAAAGRLLAKRLAQERLQGPLLVVALPRGGVPVGAEVARQLNAGLDLLIVRKIGAPGQPELAVAAVVEGPQPEIVTDEALCAATGADRAYIDRQAAVQWREVERQRTAYRGTRAVVRPEAATIILVDDGIATGVTVRAALKALRRRHPARILLAVPVAPHETLSELAPHCDTIVCLAEPQPFRAVGLHYRNFDQVGDDEVVAALRSVPEPRLPA
jgi:putative phosphoribosyl transferase